MNLEKGIDVDHDLHEVLEQLVRLGGPADIPWLTAEARRARRDARIIDETVEAVVDCSTLLVWRPDGRVDHLLNVLDGIVLTQRVRAPLANRADLWATVALQPLLNILAVTTLALDGGGEVRRAPSGHEGLVGPVRWLPDVDRFALVAVRLKDGRISAEPVDENALPSLERQKQVRALVADHYRKERWWGSRTPIC